MDDISPELLQKLRDNFNERISSDKEIAELLEKIQNGNATYKDAERYSVLVGEALKGAFGEELSSAILPDGHMYYNIGEKTVYPMLQTGHDMVSDAAADTQKALNEAAGLHLQVQRPEFNEDRAHGIIDRLDNTDQYDDVAWILGDPVVNFTQSVVDETIEENVEFHAEAGLDPRIVRTAEPKCCEWCKDLEGTYEYPAQSYVYERHENCQCVIEYFPGDGTKMHQTNWKHNTWEERKDRIQRRIRGREEAKNSANERIERVNDLVSNRYRSIMGEMDPEVFAEAVRMWDNNDEYPGLTGSEKEHVYEVLDETLPRKITDPIVRSEIGEYRYVAICKGHNQYKIIYREAIEPKWYDDIMEIVVGTDWRKYDE